MITSSDDDDIRVASEQYGCEASFRRPSELSNDHAKSVDCDLHATKFMEKKYQIKYDYVIELMCTNPLKTSEDIDAALTLQIETNADSVIAVVKLEVLGKYFVSEFSNSLAPCNLKISETVATLSSIFNRFLSS